MNAVTNLAPRAAAPTFIRLDDKKIIHAEYRCGTEAGNRSRRQTRNRNPDQAAAQDGGPATPWHCSAEAQHCCARAPGRTAYRHDAQGDGRRCCRGSAGTAAALFAQGHPVAASAPRSLGRRFRAAHGRQPAIGLQLGAARYASACGPAQDTGGAARHGQEGNGSTARRAGKKCGERASIDA